MSFYKAFAWMMNEEKGNGLPRYDGKWRDRLRAQYQNSINVSGHCVLLDGPVERRPPLPDFAVIPNGPQPSLGELLALARLVDFRKKTSDVYVPRVVASVTPTCVWNYSYRTMDTFIPELSPATFRPVVMDRASRKHWKECSEARYGDLKKQISLYNYFIKFVQEMGRYPESQDEYILYTYDKQRAREDGGAVDTLPVHMVTFVTQLFANYEKVLGEGFRDVPASEFKRVTYASMRETDRKFMDGSESVC
jgi:hypothetical protein